MVNEDVANAEDIDTKIKTNNGVDYPLVMFGTYKLAGDECVNAVEHCTKYGYAGLDTAAVYENEKQVKAGLATPGAKANLGGYTKV